LTALNKKESIKDSDIVYAFKYFDTMRRGYIDWEDLKEIKKRKGLYTDEMDL
jgi:Ca2+-binding EF-hand superfamily protein